MSSTRNFKISGNGAVQKDGLLFQYSRIAFLNKPTGALVELQGENWLLNIREVVRGYGDVAAVFLQIKITNNSQ